jgi:hypothetical protein
MGRLMLRAPLLALAAVPLLSLPCRAEEPPSAPPDARPAIDITARLRAGGDGVTLDVGGARLELRASAAPRPPDPGAPAAAHELRAAVSLDGQTTHLLLRFTPPPEGPAAGERARGERP